jgi:hypothetical protein
MKQEAGNRRISTFTQTAIADITNRNRLGASTIGDSDYLPDALPRVDLEKQTPGDRRIEPS